jgi:Leucine-rich repeat (LRR) protein
MSLRPLPLLGFFTLLLLAACENYDFKVNERVVYSPAPLFSDFEATDPALRACLEQAIADNGVRGAAQLDSLNCSHAGIETLDGLSVFSGLKTLKLSSNNIRNLVELGPATLLQELYLDNNQVVDPVPLYQLGSLRFIDLSGNPALQCPTAGAFAQVATVILPDHCR